MLKLRPDKEFYPDPSKMRYIVCTVIAETNSEINLFALANGLELSESKVQSIKYINKKEQYYIDRIYNNTKITEKKNKKSFNNQATLSVMTPDGKAINVKVFKNGYLQMTGCRDINDGKAVAEILCNCFSSNPQYILQNKKIQLNRVYIGMINSIFHSNFEISRESLVSVIRDKYEKQIESINFEVTNYQGITLKKKSTQGNVNTFLIFRSGKTLITGGKSTKDVEEMYSFINNVFKQHYNDIVLKKPIIC
tara:strand:- start:485 stop:1237 length:753 start_codon:yes stop_codon:yes gene_type:complete